MNSVMLPGTPRAQAVALRRSGKSRREIKEILGITSNSTLGKLLAGEPPPKWTRRPRAKDELRAKARLLREQGLDYDRIAAELGVSKSSVSLWVVANGAYPSCRTGRVRSGLGIVEASPEPIFGAARSGVG